MKFSIALRALVLLLLFSCKKTDSSPTSLEGTWKMILTKDNMTNTVQQKPSAIQGDVIISFVPTSISNGFFEGKTPSNVFGPNEYLLASDQTISMPVMNMTKVGETSWGSEFIDNIRDAQQYSFATGGRLNIKTIRKTLTFEKL